MAGGSDTRKDFILKLSFSPLWVTEVTMLISLVLSKSPALCSTLNSCEVYSTGSVTSFPASYTWVAVSQNTVVQVRVTEAKQTAESSVSMQNTCSSKGSSLGSWSSSVRSVLSPSASPFSPVLGRSKVACNTCGCLIATRLVIQRGYLSPQRSKYPSTLS
jgi:hypothetical protein